MTSSSDDYNLNSGYDDAEELESLDIDGNGDVDEAAVRTWDTTVNADVDARTATTSAAARDADVEEIRFDGSAKPPKPPRKKMGAVATAFVTVIVALAVVALAAGAWWMWQTRWRTVHVSVDGTEVSARADTTIQTFLDANDDFGRTRGRLLSLKGKVLDNNGGAPVSVSVNGTAVPVNDYAATTIADAREMTVTPGKDITEAHVSETRTKHYGTDINLNNGPIQVVTQQGEDGEEEVWIGKRSKEEVVHQETKPMRNLTVKSFAPQPEGKKVIALTFDDGPSIYSDKILDILKQNKVKATFFELGEQSLEFPKVEQRIVKEGHQIASHSVSHPYFPNMSAQEQRQEIESSLSDIKKASDVSTRTFRAPYGAFGVDEWKNNATLIDRNVLWDVDTLDWKRPGEKQITKEVVDYVHNGAVVLMHSGGGDRSQTVKALPEIIKQLKKKGYSFVTIDELCKMAGLPEGAEPSR